MNFLEDATLRSIEKMMRSVPNFAQRGHGAATLCRHEYSAEDCDCRYCLHNTSRGKKVVCGLGHCACMQERITAGAAERKEILTETMTGIRYPPFQRRLKQYLKKSEENPMDFRNEKHRIVFTEAIEKLNRKNYALMSAMYLLTAERGLWMTAKHSVGKNEIRFDAIHLKNSTENGYTLFCCAKDLYLGTKHITIKDLADTALIAPSIFGLICNAMTIRRFGLGAIHYNERKTDA